MEKMLMSMRYASSKARSSRPPISPIVYQQLTFATPCQYSRSAASERHTASRCAPTDNTMSRPRMKTYGATSAAISDAGDEAGSSFPDVFALRPESNPRTVLPIHPTSRLTFVFTQAVPQAPASFAAAHGAKIDNPKIAAQKIIPNSNKPPSLPHHSCSSGVINNFSKPMCSPPTSKNASTRIGGPQPTACNETP